MASQITGKRSSPKTVPELGQTGPDTDVASDTETEGTPKALKTSSSRATASSPGNSPPVVGPGPAALSTPPTPTAPTPSPPKPTLACGAASSLSDSMTGPSGAGASAPVTTLSGAGASGPLGGPKRTPAPHVNAKQGLKGRVGKPPSTGQRFNGNIGYVKLLRKADRPHPTEVHSVPHPPQVAAVLDDLAAFYPLHCNDSLPGGQLAKQKDMLGLTGACVR
eukprot:2272030-Rhodomonas_salina.1